MPTEWQKTPGGDRQGVRGGVELPQGIETPRVDELSWGDETPGVATKGKGVTGEDGCGRGGGGNPTTTQSSEENGAGGGNEGMARKPRMPPPPGL